VIATRVSPAAVTAAFRDVAPYPSAVTSSVRGPGATPVRRNCPAAFVIADGPEDPTRTRAEETGWDEPLSETVPTTAPVGGDCPATSLTGRGRNATAARAAHRRARGTKPARFSCTNAPPDTIVDVVFDTAATATACLVQPILRARPRLRNAHTLPMGVR
jgi:hypothetical protein